MGRKCLINGCVNRKRKNADSTIHLFPDQKDENEARRRMLWLEFANVGSGPEERSLKVENYGICSLHFNRDDYVRYDVAEKRLKPDAIPSTKTCKGKKDAEANAVDNCGLSSSDLALKIESHMWERKHKQELQRNEELQKEIEKLKSELTETQNREQSIKAKLESILSRFSPGQQRMLENPRLHYVHWDNNDVIKGLSLYSISRKAYELVKEQWQIPLPSLSTLRKHLAKFPIEPDVPIPIVFEMLNKKFIDVPFNNLRTQCIIGLDEVYIDHRFCYDPKLDQVFGGEKNATVYVARSLLDSHSESWKIPLMYTFNQNAPQLLHLIQKLYENGLNVVGCVSDNGPKNQRIWKQLKIGNVEDGIISTISFKHPMTENQVFWFPDFPHLLKLFRDHLLENGITLESGILVDKSWLKEIIDLQTNELKLTHKLSQKHLNIKGQLKQNVRTAFQIFSYSTATAIRVLLSHREGYQEVANFFDLVNDVSDLLNSRVDGQHYNKYKCGFGMHIEEQRDLLQRAYKCFSTMRVGNRKTKRYAPFQKGLLWNIQSLDALYEDLKQRLPYFQRILTGRTTQDFVENLFSVLRSYGGTNSTPNIYPIQLKYRLRRLIFTWSIASGDMNDNVLEQLTKLAQLQSNSDDPQVRELFREEIEEELSFVDPSVEVQDFCFQEFGTERKITEGAKEYIAGYISKKLLCSHPELSIKGANELSRNGWVNYLSMGGLMEPSSIWLAVFSKFEEYLNLIHPPDSVCRDRGVVGKLTDLLKERHPDVQEAAIKYYAMCRTKIRVKYLNRKMEDEKFLRQERKRAEDAEEEETPLLYVPGEDLLY